MNDCVMLRAVKKLLLFACLAASCLATADQTLWYGGDLDHNRALYAQTGFSRESYVYDDFDVTGIGARFTGAFGDYAALDTYQLPTSARYEIRTGMSVGNGGTLVASGLAPATVKENGNFNFSIGKFLISISGLDISLQPGRYWLSLSPVSETTFITTTSGRNGIGTPLGNGSSLWWDPSFAAYYSDVSRAFGQGTWDFSYGVKGEPVPEPTSIGVLLLAVFSIALKQRSASRR